ncbi:MoeA, N-terminal and linker domain-containing protein [Aspergillus karnatakaensis]|uniref:molybdopterin molybdotransferase MoeA n=1 Tax=Aspergillus karnatakaensis TaxID=1810916 RepID=UPI003CCCDE48
MGISYADAVQLVEREAHQQRGAYSTKTEICSLYNACDRNVFEAIYSPISTPRYDTSAMDGFALNSLATQTASPENPVTFEVIATTTAGDTPHQQSSNLEDGILPCVEIMTGAPFPVGQGSDHFDCCVPIEEVVMSENEVTKKRYISFAKPARRQQHRRLAGGDFTKRDKILGKRECIQPQHIMALASVGVTEVRVLRKLRVAVFSTGCEVLSPETPDRRHDFMIHDANGPYLTTMLKRWGAEVDFRGLIRDSEEEVENAVLKALDEKQYDVIVTSGAVSAGRCDMIPASINRIGGREVFHKVAVKPGHPIFFSMLPRRTDGETAFFGLPGNPVAAAACLRFFVLRYLSALQGLEQERSAVAKLQPSSDAPPHRELGSVQNSVLQCRKEADIFRPAIMTPCGKQVSVIADHSPGKTRPFLHANCWVHISRGVSEVREGELVSVHHC